MTEVLVKRSNNNYHSIEISGHANFSNYGNDIVCAAISSIVFGSLNTFTYYKLSESRIIIDEAIIKIELIDNHDIQVIAQTLIIQLQTIQEYYPDYINIVFK